MGLSRAVRLVAVTALVSSAGSAALIIYYSLALTHRPGAFRAIVTGLAVQNPAVLGALILWWRPRIRVAWILLVAGLVTSWSALGNVVSTAGIQLGLERGIPPNELAVSAAWSLLTNGFFPVIYAWPVLAALSFPNERLSRAARGALIGISVCAVVIATLFALAPTANEPYEQVPNAWSRPGLIAYTPAVDVVFGVAWVGLLRGIIFGTVLTCRYAIRSVGELRLQRLWLSFGAALSAVALITCGLGTVLGLIDIRWTDLTIFTVQIAVTGTIAVGISRHGLYGIENLVHRTIVYAVLTLVLGGAYVGLVSSLGVVLGRDRPAVTALATAGAALLFLPVRRFIQTQVDRRLAPRTVTAVTAIREVAGRMHREVVSATAVQDALRVALNDRTLVLTLRGRDHWHGVDGARVTMPAEPSAGRGLDQVRHSGAVIAAIDRVGALDYQPELIRRVMVEASAPLAILRSSQELERQLAEVQESRTRIVHAGFEARRQLERDLHDGAQQRLVALGIFLRRVQSSHPGPDRLLEGQLDEAVDQVSEAIAVLRGIAAGIRPPHLQDGLLVALKNLVRHSPVAIELQFPGCRLAPEMEDAAYFITCEAITNAIKHGTPSLVTVRGIQREGWLYVSVDDDGPGGAQPAVGHQGLDGMMDRARSHGGTLTVESPPDRGTTVRLALPIENAAVETALSRDR